MINREPVENLFKHVTIQIKSNWIVWNGSRLQYALA